MKTEGLKHYNSDGCSGVPKRLVDYRIYICCVFHDLDYKMWWMPRRQADKNLKRCMIKSGHPKLALVFYYGVRACGWMFKTRKRPILL